MATAAERWKNRQLRRLAREAAALEEEASRFVSVLQRSPGPYGDGARDLTRKALDLARLAAFVDGMQEINDLMTEEEG